MAINFEAANMAGYNNPKIEVFKAVLAADGTTLAQYPVMSAIMAAINRGSIPIIILNLSDIAGYLLMFSEWEINEAGVILRFSTHASTAGSTKIQITYSYNDENQPKVLIE